MPVSPALQQNVAWGSGMRIGVTGCQTSSRSSQELRPSRPGRIVPTHSRHRLRCGSRIRDLAGDDKTFRLVEHGIGFGIGAVKGRSNAAGETGPTGLGVVVDVKLDRARVSTQYFGQALKPTVRS